MNERRKTIVGGRSRGENRSSEYPRGIEIILKKAKVDSLFRELLLQDKLEAARSIGLELRVSEKNLLTSASDLVLKYMIEHTTVPKHHRKIFRTKDVAAMITLAVASTVTMSAYGNGTQEEIMGVLAEEIEHDWEYVSEERMYEVQRALDLYHQDNGRYPTTEEWITQQNPLQDYVDPKILFDPWKRKFHYQAVWEEDAVVTYKLQSWGPDVLSPADTIACPFNADEHRFPSFSALSLIVPASLSLSKKALEEEEKTHFTFIARHSDNSARVEWYIGHVLMGKTEGTHELHLDPDQIPNGNYILLLTDDKGSYVIKYMTVSS